MREGKGDKMNYISTKELAKMHTKSISFMSMILCRPEFGKFRKNNDKDYYKFKDEEPLHSLIDSIVKQKKTMIGNTCRGAY